MTQSIVTDLVTHVIEQGARPNISVALYGRDGKDRVTLGIYRDLESMVDADLRSMRIDMPVEVFHQIMQAAVSVQLHILDDHAAEAEEPVSEAKQMPDPLPAEPAPDHALLVAQLKEKTERLRDRTTSPIRTGPLPEPTAHDLIMQMEGNDADEDAHPDESPAWVREWLDEEEDIPAPSPAESVPSTQAQPFREPEGARPIRTGPRPRPHHADGGVGRGLWG